MPRIKHKKREIAIKVSVNEEEFKPLQDSIIENHYKFKSSYNLKTATTTEN